MSKVSFRPFPIAAKPNENFSLLSPHGEIWLETFYRETKHDMAMVSELIVTHTVVKYWSPEAPTLRHIGKDFFHTLNYVLSYKVSFLTNFSYPVK